MNKKASPKAGYEAMLALISWNVIPLFFADIELARASDAVIWRGQHLSPV
jgi:hypothetical protein